MILYCRHCDLGFCERHQQAHRDLDEQHDLEPDDRVTFCAVCAGVYAPEVATLPSGHRTDCDGNTPCNCDRLAAEALGIDTSFPQYAGVAEMVAENTRAGRGALEPDGLAVKRKPEATKEITIDRCVLCDDELDPSHKTSEHGTGHAHDECIEVLEASTRVLTMGYPNDLPLHERLERYTADASLCASTIQASLVGTNVDSIQKRIETTGGTAKAAPYDQTAAAALERLHGSTSKLGRSLRNALTGGRSNR